MTHRLKSVKVKNDLTLLVVFQNGVEKIYDVRMLYQVFPQFRVFETDKSLFQQVQVDVGGYGISWNESLDLDAEDLWEDGVETGVIEEMDIVVALAESLIKARESAGLTQRQLSEITGLYQADISKIERGLSNPSIMTLKRLAEGMGVKLKVEFKICE